MQPQLTPRVTPADVLAYLDQHSQTTGAYTSLPALANALSCTEAEVQRLVKQLEDDGYALVQGSADALVVGLTYAGTREARKEMALLQPGPRRDPAALRAEMTKLALRCIRHRRSGYRWAEQRRRSRCGSRRTVATRFWSLYARIGRAQERQRDPT